MGQSGHSSLKPRAQREIPLDSLLSSQLPYLTLFTTELGWLGLLGRNRTVWHLKIGHASASEVREALLDSLDLSPAQSFPEADWFPALRRKLQQYAAGNKTDFTDIQLKLPPLTPFQHRVVRATRTIPYGRTLTYAQVAEKAGAPHAARAVGNVMASNRFPILIPCHRVVASGGRLGGFSAPQGVQLKEHMLALEAEAAPQAQPQLLS